MFILITCFTILTAVPIFEPHFDNTVLHGYGNAGSTEAPCKSICKSNRFTTCGTMDSRFKGIFRRLGGENPPADWVPDQSCTICPLRPAVEFRSLYLAGARPTKFQFRNVANEKAHVFWQDYQGNPVYKATLAPSQIYGFRTHEGHAFRVWSHDYSLVLLDFTAGRYALHNENNAVSYEESAHMPNFEDPDFKRKPTPIDWDRARLVGMVNRAGVNMDIYYASSNESMIVQLRPGNNHYEVTYPNHVFRARIHDSEQPLLVEVQISDVNIPDCELRRSCGCISEEERVVINLGNQECVNDTSATVHAYIPSEIIPSFFKTYSV